MNIKHAVPVITAAIVVSLAVSNPVRGEASQGNSAQPARVVSLRDLDLSKPADIRTLYVRIGNAARKVCRELIPAHNGPSSIRNGQCRHTLIDAAVAEMNHPALTAFSTKKSVQVTASR